MTCPTCNGRGVVLVDLRSFGFGAGFLQFMTAGTRAVHGDDGSCRHEIVCPRCGSEKHENHERKEG